METWTKICGLPLLFNFEPHPFTRAISFSKRPPLFRVVSSWVVATYRHRTSFPATQPGKAWGDTWQNMGDTWQKSHGENLAKHGEIWGKGTKLLVQQPNVTYFPDPLKVAGLGWSDVSTRMWDRLVGSRSLGQLPVLHGTVWGGNAESNPELYIWL